MKKLIPLLVVAAGAVAYNVYKNRKEAEKQEKTFVVIDDSNDTPDKSEPVKETVEQTVLEEASNDEIVEETQIETVQVEELIEEIVEEPVAEEEPEVVETKVDEIAEAMQEVQQELGIFETLSDMDEPYGRPSFFHVTDDSFIEPEIEPATEIVSTIIVEDDDVELVEEAPEVVEEVSEELPVEPAPVEAEIEAVEPEAVEEVQEEILSTIVVDDTEEELDVEIELILEEQLDINEVVEFAEEVEETILSTILVEDEPEEDVVEEEQITEEEIVEDVAESVEETEEILEFVEEEVVEDEPIEVDALIEEIAEQIEEVSEEPVFVNLSEENESELEPLQSYNTPEVDELMKTIAGQVKAADQAEEPVSEEEPVEEVVEEIPQFEEGDYLQDIRKITELYSEKVAQYNIRFPYLSSRFIDDTLKFSNQFNTEYPIGTRVAIEHHMHFNAVEDLFVFAQIIRQSGYLVKEGAEDKTLIVVREMFVDNNTILHDVFKVANQVYCLSGEYQKFRITKR